MNKIIRYFNQNRKKIILGVAIIVSIIIFIQILNQMAKNQKEKNNTMIPQEDLSDLPIQSMITAETVDKETTQENVNLVEQFINLCNQGNSKEAYNMLSEECKTALFSTEEQFLKGYYNIIFTQTKLYGIQNFRNTSGYYTYQVKFYNDALATGKMQESGIYQDYITIDKKQNKLNINSFIRKQECNKTVEENGIQITVLSKEVYKEHEKYNILVKNNTQKTILIDTKKSTQSVYAIGSDNGRYDSFMSEIADNWLRIEKGFTKNYQLKINKIYNPSVTIRAICFSDIVTDEEMYKNEVESKERLKITINL